MDTPIRRIVATIDDTPPGSDDDSEAPDESTPEYDTATVPA